MAVPHPGLGNGHNASAESGRAGMHGRSHSRPARGTIPIGPV